MKLRLLLLALPPLLAAHSGCSSTVCGEGTTSKFDPATGNTTCIQVSQGVQCGDRAVLAGGICVADATKFPTCGDGTKYDPASNKCLGTGMTSMNPPTCPSEPAGKFCINGVVRYLKDGSSTKGTPFEVRAYDPLAFLANPAHATPQKTAMTDENGNYIIQDLSDTGGLGLIALAVVDPGGPTNYVLSGSGQNNVGGKVTAFQVDLFAIEKTLVASWDGQAGLAPGDTFEMNGAYLGRFLDKMLALESTAKPVAAVTLTFNAAPAKNQFFFKGAMTTIDKTLTATDAATGSVVQKVMQGQLGNYSGMGGGITWETFQGASVPGVVFVQKFHPPTTM